MTFRFVHTADLHLDSPLRSLAMRDEGLQQLIGNASRTALNRIVTLCLEEQVDALLIAGDLYDGAQTSMKTARFLSQQLARLDQAGIRTFMIRGNHDAASKITRELLLPDSVTVFGGRAGIEQFDLRGQAIAVHGISFQKPHAPESLLAKFKPPVAGALNIGMLHTSLAGDSGHDRYAPCTVAELRDTGFDYWALGHIHIRAVHEDHIVMAGIPQGRDIGEAGEKTVTLGTFGPDGLVLEERSVAVARFERIAVPVATCDDWPDVVHEVQAAVSRVRQMFDAEHLVIRLSLTGEGPQSWRIRRDLDHLTNEARASAESIGTVWIDKLEIAAGPPVIAAGAVGELQALVDIHSAGFQTAAATEWDALLAKLPAGLRNSFGTTPDEIADQRLSLIAEGVAEVLAHLQGDGQAE